MAPSFRVFAGYVSLTFILTICWFAAPPAEGADHGDTPLLISLQRHDARITDLHAFTRGENLVLSLSLDPTIPPEVTEYVFASDLVLRFYIDNNSKVRFDDATDLAVLGGTIVKPKHIKEDVVLEVGFRKDGRIKFRQKGVRGRDRDRINLFAGLRDDPFIRGPRIGRNVAAVVVELPLEIVTAGQPALVIWATSRVPDVHGPIADMAGRALRNQFPENDPMNTLHPKHQARSLGTAPDVMIFDTSRPAAFPNGRELADDVLDLVGDPRPLANDDPFPSQNDVPFLNTFPYLAPPHLP